MEREDFVDWLAGVIDDSMDVDWNSRDAAHLVVLRLDNAGLLARVLDAVKGLE